MTYTMKIKTALLFLFIAPSVQAITEEEFRNGYRVFIEETARSIAESRRHEAKKEKYLELQADCNTYWIYKDRIDYINKYPEVTEGNPKYIRDKIELREIMLAVKDRLEFEKYNCNLL